MSPPKNRLEALRHRTGEARAAVESALRAPPDDSLRPGGLYLVPATAELPIEWAVLEAGPGIARPLLVPADVQPFLARTDVRVPSTEPCGPLALRCGFSVRLPEAAFEPGTWKRTGSLTAKTLGRARQRQRELAAGAGPPPRRGSADDDPEYRNWVTEVLEPARAALEALDPGSGVIPFRARSSRWSPRGNPWAVAASVLLAVSVGSLGGLWWQHRELAELRRAHVLNPPDYTVRAGERGSNEVVVPSGESHVLLFLQHPEDGVFSQDTYRLVISRRGPRGHQEEVWREEVRARVAQVFVLVATDLLPPGDYVFRLEDPRIGREVVTYDLEVTAEEARP